ncbi:DENN domain-containing protein 10-like [Babylonia areolata]|uniref:DENN domain-containing protein 10-like n=1 Tax=Babylonia areolata TaxID=304850 RepID=UPI003FD04C6E
MAAFMELIGAGLIEKDTNGDVIWAWSYPSVTAEQREFLLLKSGLGSENAIPVNYLYCQWRQVWYYILRTDVSGGSESGHLSKVTDIALVLISRDFNPEKYETLCLIFLRQYKQTGNPTSMLEGYLSVVTRGTCANGENGKFSSGDYDKKQAYSKVCLKDIIQTFGVETILLYTAMLLKKRVLVYCPPHSLGQLLEYTRSLPALVWHRQNWSMVYPYVHLSEPEAEDLVSVSHFVAGVTEAAAEGRLDLYDLFVNTPNSQISVAPHAKESFAMGRLHKDIATAMVQLAEEEDSTDQDIIKTVASKTRELLNNLKSLATTGENGQLSLSLETLRARKMPPATENFLFSLAACEGFVQL